ncbi:uncharacterized protein C10orf143 homolog [Denticeps clupeoides]|uniref:uncharacterized protein C10orf143 homolog n=1 Tax=Denticeps clupeoides TaxID=299321 RepID=UPI0010A58E80|nr:uncharacterized protein C10orf143 homolog [Denticeps clupeoides]
MDCVSTPLQSKRRREEGTVWECEAKRARTGTNGCTQVGCGAVAEVAMVTWDTRHQQGFQNGPRRLPNDAGLPEGRGPGQQCVRCMAGESGHINHIMGY